jgi:hypothetical protein
MTLEQAKLGPLAEAAQDLVNPGPALVIRDVIGDDVENSLGFCHLVN